MRSQISDNIKRIINSKGLKNRFVAEKAGYSPKTFSDMLCGRCSITDKDVIKLMKVLECTANDLFGFDKAS